METRLVFSRFQLRTRQQSVCHGVVTGSTIRLSVYLLAGLIIIVIVIFFFSFFFKSIFCGPNIFTRSAWRFHKCCVDKDFREEGASDLRFFNEIDFYLLFARELS